MPKFEPILEVIKSLCLRSGDNLQRNKGLYLNCAKDIYNDLNEDSLKIFDRVKIPVRSKFKVNKRTNSIELPCDALRLCSVNVIDGTGAFLPVWRNEQITDDIVDISTAKLPNGNDISFTCIDRKYINPQGFFYQDTQFPERIYTNGVWTNTILKTENTKLCKVDVDSNGCCCDTDANVDALCHACGIKTDGIPFGGNAQSFCGNPNVDTWRYFCSSKIDWFGVQCGSHLHGRIDFRNIYNLNELGNRLVLPHDFPFDHVMVRYFADIQLKNLMIPYMAKECFMSGLQWFANSHRDDKQQLAMVYERKYAAQKWGLLGELNKYRIAELKMITTPPVKMPSYYQHHHKNDWFS